MKNLTHFFSRFQGSKLRIQILAAFVLLSAIIGLTGGAGLFLANKVGNSAGNITSLALPLIKDTSVIVEATQAARGQLAEIKADPANADFEAIRVQLGALDQVSNEKLSRLSELAGVTGLSVWPEKS